jgi:hypothetical protein
MQGSKSQGNVSSPKPHLNHLTTESKDNELPEISKSDFRSLLLKLVSDLKVYLNKLINEVRKSIQDIDSKDSNIEEKFIKEMDITKNNHVELLEMKTKINQINTWSCPRYYLTLLKSLSFCFTVVLIISHYLPHCLSSFTFPLSVFLAHSPL